MHYEYLIRIVIAGLLGALIGLEREKKFKEAGLRTHFLVGIGSAVMMIISKYAFADILNESTIVLDPSRIAAQVVSGVGFLGAGMILVQRQSIHGLTTAAGIWATAGVGLAIGAGMYEVGVFGGILVIVGLEFLKRIFLFAIPKVYQLTIQATKREVTEQMIDIFTKEKITILDYSVILEQDEREKRYTISYKLQSDIRIENNELTKLISRIPSITVIKLQ